MSYFILRIPRKAKNKTWQPHIAATLATLRNTPQIINCPICKKKRKIKGILKNPLTENTSAGHYIIHRDSNNGLRLQQIFHVLRVFADAKPLCLETSEGIRGIER